MEAWTAASVLRAEGAEVHAVTAWALGLADWDTELRERRNHHEPGAFDIRRSLPRPTLLSDAVTALAQEGQFTHPALLTAGWWQRKDSADAQLRRA